MFGPVFDLSSALLSGRAPRLRPWLPFSYWTVLSRLPFALPLPPFRLLVCVCSSPFRSLLPSRPPALPVLLLCRARPGSFPAAGGSNPVGFLFDSPRLFFLCCGVPGWLLFDPCRAQYPSLPACLVLVSLVPDASRLSCGLRFGRRVFAGV